MNHILKLLPLALILAGCSQEPSGIRITQQAPPAAAAAVVQAAPRSEPVFYNGTIYHINFAPAATGGYDIAVVGMSATQKKDAVAVGTSSLRQFACKSKQSGKLLSDAVYSGSQWRMTAHCA